MAALSYWFVRTLLIEQDLESYEFSIAKTVASFEGVDQSNGITILVTAARQLSEENRVSRVSAYDLDQNQLWVSDRSWPLTSFESRILRNINSVDGITSIIDDGFQRLIEVPSFSNLRSALLPESQYLPTLTKLFSSNNGSLGVIKALRDYSVLNKIASLVAIGVFATILISGLWIFLLIIPRSTVEKPVTRKDKKVLDQQVSQLSELLNENRELQRKTKVANSRAVELNERFLRRVGADLHDGPAQEIGFAAMTLNQIANRQNSKELGQEFHAVKKALEESLKEIREISTGLVMPELEQMSLQEGVGKVVQRHQINTGASVEELYYNLPDDIELPIKICAYRFAQEGLTNSYKHGKAKKCKFTAQVINDVLQLSLKDDGIGFRQSELSTDGGHLGLMGLKDRIESLGGRLSINSKLGVGTAIKVSLEMGDE